jgi:hypothetical protein
MELREYIQNVPNLYFADPFCAMSPNFLLLRDVWIVRTHAESCRCKPVPYKLIRPCIPLLSHSTTCLAAHLPTKPPITLLSHSPSYSTQPFISLLSILSHSSPYSPYTAICQCLPSKPLSSYLTVHLASHLL